MHYSQGSLRSGRSVEDSVWWGGGLLCFATMLRYNAPAATLPIVLLLFEWGAGRRSLRRYGLAFVVWLVITLLGFGVSHVLTEKKSHAWHSSVALLDIAGTIYDAPALDDVAVRSLLQGISLVPDSDIQSAFRHAYSPRWWGPLVFGEKRVMMQPIDADARASVSAAWIRCVTTFPGAFFEHRRRVFWRTLALGRPPNSAIWDEFVTEPLENDLLQHRAQRSDVQAWVGLQIRRLEHSIVFRPWAYLLLAVLLLPLCRRSRVAVALLGSGILYELTLLVVAPSSDYRYSHWMIVTTTLGAVVAYHARKRSVDEPRS